MARLEDLKEGAVVKGIRPDGQVIVINAKWHGDSVVELTYKDPGGKPGNELLFRDREAMLEIGAPGRSWSFDTDASMLRLVSEAYRIGMAKNFRGFSRTTPECLTWRAPGENLSFSLSTKTPSDI